ncbi:hypothetical protein F5B18DRAFT_633203 [Nemania serpens]|nr:hypothetical protein F5B18DRAFT_633203 [Nemania serpens]
MYTSLRYLFSDNSALSFVLVSRLVALVTEAKCAVIYLTRSSLVPSPDVHAISNVYAPQQGIPCGHRIGNPTHFISPLLPPLSLKVGTMQISENTLGRSGLTP